MGADNVVLLFILVWTFTSVCHGDDDISVNCEDVTGTVGEEVTLTCSVSLSLECTKRCITGYKFTYPTTYDASKICKLSADPCEQRNSFTCRFTPTTAKTEQFRFFVQTPCGRKTAEFTVTITERSTPEPDTEDPGKEEPSKHETDTEDPDPTGYGSMALITGAVVGCSIFIIIIMTILCVKRFRRNTPSGVQMKYERSASAEPTMTAVNVQSETK